MTNYWLTDDALEILHGPDRCQECRGREWIEVEDPLYAGASIDVRCPVCCQARKDDQ